MRSDLGLIIWDEVQIGDYSISGHYVSASHHASFYEDLIFLFLLLSLPATATTVNFEPPSFDFDGILGLALPLNSIISQIIPPVTNNNPDGACFSSTPYLVAVLDPGVPLIITTSAIANGIY